MNTLKVNTPEELHQAIGEFLQSNYSRENLVKMYDGTRKCATSFRGIYSVLPVLSACKSDPLDGLQYIMDWSKEASKVVDDIVSDLNQQTINETIRQLKKLRDISSSILSLVNSKLKEQAQKEARAKVEKEYKNLNEEASKTKGMLLIQQTEVVMKIEREAQAILRRETKDAVQIYLSKDPTFKNRVSQQGNEINKVLERLNKLVGSDTPTGKLLDIYCKLKSIPLQSQFDDVGYAYSPIDDWADVICGGCNRLYTSIDNVIKTFEEIQTKASVEQETQNMIKLFISHSSRDQKLVEKLTELVKNALCLSSSEIRCTTIDGYRLSGGAKTNEQLKREVCGTKAFIGLISFAATDSIYVLFELGARWGSDKHLLPLLAPGVSSDILKGPLSDLNALSCGNGSQLHQLVKELAEILEIESELPQAYQRYIDGILAIPPSEDKISFVGDQVEAIPACKPSDVQIRIMKAVAGMNRREATVANIAIVTGLSDMEAKYNLDELARKHKFLNWTGNMNQDVPDFYTLTHKGRGFVLSQRDR